MRISKKEIEIIKELANKIFGKGTKVFLFGSRIHDDKKGGDIDLLIRNPHKSKLTITSKVEFLAELKRMIGDQKNLMWCWIHCLLPEKRVFTCRLHKALLNYEYHRL